jgi:UDP-glucose 4-epimerase
VSQPLVYITGARGFIGRHVAKACAANGAKVFGIGHGAWSRPEYTLWGIAGWLNGDVSASNLTLLNGIAGSPDIVIHLAGGSSVGAAIGQPQEDFCRSVVSTAELLEWLRIKAAKAQLVAVSSAAVYGDGHTHRIPEVGQLAPYSPYGVHKLMMEQLCQSYAVTYGLSVIMPRLFSVYGAGLTKQFLWDACSQLRNETSDLSFGGTGREIRDWVHVHDVATILANIGRHASEQAPVVNIGTGEGTSVGLIASTLVSQWRNTLGLQADRQVKFTGKMRVGDPFSLIADITKMSNLNFRCTRSVHDGLREYVSWFMRFRASLK